MTTLFFLLLAVVLIVLLPVRLRVCGRNDARRGPTLDVRLRPWIGLAGIRLFYTDGGWRAGALLGWWTVWVARLRTRKGTKKKRRSDATRRKEAEVSDRFSAKVERLLRAGRRLRNLTLPVRRSALRFLNGFRLRRIECKITFGASDPASTGQVYGCIMAVSYLAGATGSVHVTPDFQTQRLDGEGRVEIRIYPHRLLLASVYLGWRVALAWVSERRNRKRSNHDIIGAGATG